MAAPTNYYVDPTSGNDTTGDGSSGTPWATMNKALTTITRDLTNGDQINLKAGTDDVLSAAMPLGTYGAPTNAAPLIIRGYTTTANDGGIGGISGGGTTGLISTANDNHFFIDLKLHNTGSNTIAAVDRESAFINCEIANTTARGVVADNSTSVINCYFHTISGSEAIDGGGGEAITITGCYFDVAVTTLVCRSSAVVSNNIIKLPTSSGAEGIRMIGNDSKCYNNTVFCVTGGTNAGITTGVTALVRASIYNNFVEGFSGTGGKGFEVGTGDGFFLVGSNGTRNCSTDEEFSNAEYILNNITTNDQFGITTSPFTDPSTGDFSVDTQLKSKGLDWFTGGGTTATTVSHTDIGAAQREEPAGGGGVAQALAY